MSAYGASPGEKRVNVVGRSGRYGMKVYVQYFYIAISIYIVLVTFLEKKLFMDKIARWAGPFFG